MDPGPAGIKQLQELFFRILNISVFVAVLALLVALIISGIKFLTSGGDAKGIFSASQGITWALLGILFLVLAWLVLLLIQAFTGVNVTGFNLCQLFPGGKCP